MLDRLQKITTKRIFSLIGTSLFASYFSLSLINIMFVGAAEGFVTGVTNEIHYQIDTQPPTITITGSQIITHEAATPYVDLGAAASDDIDGPVNVSIDESAVLTRVLGSYFVTITAQDIAGNQSLVTRTVKVTDTLPPVIEFIGPAVVTIPLGATFEDPGVIATDLLDGNLSGSVGATSNLNTDQIGTYFTSYFVSDQTGNTASLKRQIIVDQYKLFLPMIQPSFTGEIKLSHNRSRGITSFVPDGTVDLSELVTNGLLAEEVRIWQNDQTVAVDWQPFNLTETEINFDPDLFGMQAFKVQFRTGESKYPHYLY